ncbi:MAG: hypothetical protein ACRD88_21110, partial [Terriglobia bacterium]
MRLSAGFLGISLSMLAFLGSLLVPDASSQSQERVPPYPPPIVSPEEFDRWMKELSNWGRWGKDDQLGAANLITPAKRRQAVALVQEGISVSLARRPLLEKALDNSSPF